MSFISSIFGAKKAPSQVIHLLDSAAFKSAISNSAVLLYDVRTAKEYRMGNIENSVNVDFFDRGNFIAHFKKLDKSHPVFLYCRSGNRSHQAALILEELGFKNVYDLKGGYLAWT